MRVGVLANGLNCGNKRKAQASPTRPVGSESFTIGVPDEAGTVDDFRGPLALGVKYCTSARKVNQRLKASWSA